MADHLIQLGDRRWAFYVECWVDRASAGMRFVAHIVIERRDLVDGEEAWQRAASTPFQSSVLASYDSARSWATGWISCAHDVRHHWLANDERVPPFPVTAVETDEVPRG
jgi:hypothetical protein